MELKDFVKSTITSINEAIIDSQNELKDKGVIINSEKTSIGTSGRKHLNSKGVRFVQDVDFEISVEIDEKSEKEGGGKLKVANLISLGGGISNEYTSTNLNKIKFTIPIAFNTEKTPIEYNTQRKIRH